MLQAFIDLQNRLLQMTKQWDDAKKSAGKLLEERVSLCFRYVLDSVSFLTEICQCDFDTQAFLENSTSLPRIPNQPDVASMRPYTGKPGFTLPKVCPRSVQL